MRIGADTVLVSITNSRDRKRRWSTAFEMEIMPPVKSPTWSWQSSTLLSTYSDEFDNYLDGLSSLELLTRDLIWKIIEYVPEAVFQLRATSRTLRSQVDSFALQPATVPLVKELVFTGAISRFLSPTLDVSMYVPKGKSALFELRLKLREPLHGSNTTVHRTHFALSGRPNIYNANLNTVIDDENSWAHLRGAIGRRIEKVAMNQCITRETLLTISAMLETIKFKKLKVANDQLSSTFAKVITRTVIKCEVDHLFMSFRKLVFRKVNPVAFLIDLSTFVKSMHLYQSEKKTEFDASRKFFFGCEDIEWAPVFLEMFSRRLNKLCIENYTYPLYLTRDSADALRKRLPQMKKKFWFASTCEAYPNGLNYTSNSHLVQASDNELGSRFFTVKYASREKERFVF